MSSFGAMTWAQRVVLPSSGEGQQASRGTSSLQLSTHCYLRVTTCKHLRWHHIPAAAGHQKGRGSVRGSREEPRPFQVDVPEHLEGQRMLSQLQTFFRSDVTASKRLLESMDPGPPAPLEPQPQKGRETERPPSVVPDPKQSSPDKVAWPVLLLSGSACSEEACGSCTV